MRATNNPRREACADRTVTGGDLRTALKTADGLWTDEAIAAAEQDLEARVDREWTQMEDAQERLDEAQRGALKAKAARLLLDAALVELALGQQPEPFGDEAYPVGFDKRAVIGLERHGYPWTSLLGCAHSHIKAPRPTDAFFVQIQGDPPVRRKRRLAALKRRARGLIQDVAEGEA